MNNKLKKINLEIEKLERADLLMNLLGNLKLIIEDENLSEYNKLDNIRTIYLETTGILSERIEKLKKLMLF